MRYPKEIVKPNKDPFSDHLNRPSNTVKRYFLNNDDLDDIYTSVSMGNVLLDCIKAAQVGTDYYIIQAVISASKSASLLVGNNVMVSLSNSVDILNDYYWGKFSTEDLNTLALKGAISLASIALCYSPYSYEFKILATALSVAKFTYNSYETAHDITHSITINLCKARDKAKCYDEELDFLQFKNLGEILIKEGCASSVFIKQQELSEKPLFMEYIYKHCESESFDGDIIYKCHYNNHSWEVFIAEDNSQNN
jgi:hypothetical protein